MRKEGIDCPKDGHRGENDAEIEFDSLLLIGRWNIDLCGRGWGVNLDSDVRWRYWEGGGNRKKGKDNNIERYEGGKIKKSNKEVTEIEN